VDFGFPFLPGCRFLGFHYSCSEMTAHGDRAHVRARKASLENGKLTMENFEGTMDRVVFDQAAERAQAFMLGQTRQFLNLFAAMSPFAALWLTDAEQED